MKPTTPHRAPPRIQTAAGRAMSPAMAAKIAGAPSNHTLEERARAAAVLKANQTRVAEYGQLAADLWRKIAPDMGIDLPDEVDGPVYEIVRADPTASDAAWLVTASYNVRVYDCRVVRAGSEDEARAKGAMIVRDAMDDIWHDQKIDYESATAVAVSAMPYRGEPYRLVDVDPDAIEPDDDDEPHADETTVDAAVAVAEEMMAQLRVVREAMDPSAMVDMRKVADLCARRIGEWANRLKRTL